MRITILHLTRATRKFGAEKCNLQKKQQPCLCKIVGFAERRFINAAAIVSIFTCCDSNQDFRYHREDASKLFRDNTCCRLPSALMPIACSRAAVKLGIIPLKQSAARLQLRGPLVSIALSGCKGENIFLQITKRSPFGSWSGVALSFNDIFQLRHYMSLHAISAFGCRYSSVRFV